MTNLTKKKRLFVLSVLLCFLVFFNGFFAINQFNSNNSNLSNIIEAENPNQLNKDGILHNADYSVDYQSDGKDLNITLHQSIVNEGNPLYEITDFNSIANRSFEIDSPVDTSFNSSYTEIKVENIYAPNKTLETELYASNTDTLIRGQMALTSFYANSSCILTNASFEMEYVEAGNPMITIYLFNATAANQPNISGDYSGKAIGSFGMTQYFGTKWYNIDFTDQLLNNTLTKNKMWFIGLQMTSIVVTDNPKWKARWDASVPASDTSKAFTYAPLTSIALDYVSELKLVPINSSTGLIDNTPAPESIGMEINGTEIRNGVGNTGTWTSKTSLPSKNNQLNFTLDAGWWDVQCNITKIQVNTRKLIYMELPNLP